MKSGGGGAMGVVPSYGVPAKRRWRGFVIAVLGLVILSMLVPLVFLLGLHNGFHSSGYVYEQRSSPSSQKALERYDRHDVRHNTKQSESEKSSHVQELITKFEPTLPKDVLKNYARGDKNGTINRGANDDKQNDKQRGDKNGTINRGANDDKQNDKQKGFKAPPNAVPQPPPTSNNPKGGQIEQVTDTKTSSADRNGKSCELTYGSYCLWQQEHKEDMKDAMTKKLKDQLFVARSYYPSIAKLPAQDKLSRQLKQNIQELEHVLSESTTDADLPPLVKNKSEKMEVVIARAKSVPVECSNVDKKLRQIFDLTEDEADFHRKQSAFLYKLNVQTMPKSFHCLSLKLTVEYFKSSHYEEEANSEKFEDPSLHHYIIFSNNVLAASVVINSTVTNAKASQNQVFHVLTDGQNYYAMKLWFMRNNYEEAAVQVLNVEHLGLDSQKEDQLQLSLPEEFRVSFHSYDNPSMGQIMTKYLSIFSHSHYLLPEIFSKLKKVVVLDDDVVIQKDLSALWSLDMGDKVNGAVQFCSVRLGQLKSYLGGKGSSQNSCAWMSGLNIVDLARWRALGLTQTYRRLIKELSVQKGSTKAAAWPVSLLAFENKIYPLNASWVQSGLGYDYAVDSNAIKTASVLHYNGKMKPWLDLGIPNYRRYWKKFLNKEDQLLSECKVS